MALVSMGSYVNTVSVGTNLIDEFIKIEKNKHPDRSFQCVKKIAIEAPGGSTLSINDIELTMPSTGILEFDYGLLDIEKLVFNDSVQVNIIYMY